MRSWVISALAIFASFVHAERKAVFHETFENVKSLQRWGGGTLVNGKSGRALKIINHTPTAAAVRKTAIDVKDLVGKTVELRATVRYENVSKPPNPWNGVKVMLVITTDSGTTYPQIPFGVGTAGWLTHSKSVTIPEDARSAVLVLGLEMASGTLLVDEVSILVGRPGSGKPVPGLMFKGHKLPRLRGVMHGPRFDRKNFDDLAKMGVNHVRWQLNWTPMKSAETWAQDIPRFRKWLARILPDAEEAANACERHGMLMLLDLHTPPGGRREGGICRMFEDDRYAELFIETWEMLARRFKHCKAIYAYDLVNEPVMPPDKSIEVWTGLFAKTARRIRAIDPGRTVVFEPGPWGSCRGFDNMSGPLPIDRVVYSFHMYEPHRFTHQFQFDTPVRYPGKIDGRRWDKDALLRAMQPAVRFQREFNVHIYVGEFSAIRWAPDGSAYRYLKDVVDLFEKLDWDWAYHAYREFHGWSFELGADKDNLKPVPNPRQELFESWFKTNSLVRPGQE